MKRLALLAIVVVSLPMTALACPIGMVFNGNGCSPPYEYTGWDMLEDQRNAIDAIGSDRPTPDHPTFTPEEWAEFARLQKEKQEADDKRREQLTKGLWHVKSTSTPEGNLCAATFAKYTSGKNGVDGGVVTIMGFQPPKQDAWVIFQGAALPKPRDVKKIKIGLQWDDEPVQTIPVLSSKTSRDIGAITLTVPGLKAAVDGMRDSQRFKLSLNGKAVMTIQWTNGAKSIAALRACGK